MSTASKTYLRAKPEIGLKKVPLLSLLHPMAEFNAKKVTKVDAGVIDGVDGAVFSVEGADGGSFAIASSKKELKQLMKSDVDVVYDAKKGKATPQCQRHRYGLGKEEGWWLARHVQRQAQTQC